MILTRRASKQQNALNAIDNSTVKTDVEMSTNISSSDDVALSPSKTVDHPTAEIENEVASSSTAMNLPTSKLDLIAGGNASLLSTDQLANRLSGSNSTRSHLHTIVDNQQQLQSASSSSNLNAPNVQQMNDEKSPSSNTTNTECLKSHSIAQVVPNVASSLFLPTQQSNSPVISTSMPHRSFLTQTHHHQMSSHPNSPQSQASQQSNSGFGSTNNDLLSPKSGSPFSPMSFRGSPRLRSTLTASQLKQKSLLMMPVTQRLPIDSRYANRLRSAQQQQQQQQRRSLASSSSSHAKRLHHHSMSDFDPPFTSPQTGSEFTSLSPQIRQNEFIQQMSSQLLSPSTMSPIACDSRSRSAASPQSESSGAVAPAPPSFTLQSHSTDEQSTASATNTSKHQLHIRSQSEFASTGSTITLSAFSETAASSSSSRSLAHTVTQSVRSMRTTTSAKSTASSSSSVAATSAAASTTVLSLFAAERQSASPQLYSDRFIPSRSTSTLSHAYDVRQQRHTPAGGALRTTSAAGGATAAQQQQQPSSSGGAPATAGEQADQVSSATYAFLLRSELLSHAASSPPPPLQQQLRGVQHDQTSGHRRRNTMASSPTAATGTQVTSSPDLSPTAAAPSHHHRHASFASPDQLSSPHTDLHHFAVDMDDDTRIARPVSSTQHHDMHSSPQSLHNHQRHDDDVIAIDSSSNNSAQVDHMSRTASARHASLSALEAASAASSYARTFRFRSPLKSQYATTSTLTTTASASPLSSHSLSVLHHSGSALLAAHGTTRRISRIPFKVLDAPSLKDDFYLNLVDWSTQNVVCVGLGSAVYMWSAHTSQVTKLCELAPSTDTAPDLAAQSNDCVTSVCWSAKGHHVAVGCKSGDVQLWDAAQCRLVRTMKGHSARVGALAWGNGNVDAASSAVSASGGHAQLASGGRDRCIYLRDVRSSDADWTAKLASHKQEVCGLRWSPDGVQLASGSNDNRCHIYNVSASSAPLWRFSAHVAAVKALAWSPHANGLLASGGGTADRCIRFWNTQTGVELSHIDTGSQVCNLLWSRTKNEIVSTHGYSLNQVIVWKYPMMKQLATLTGHTLRVLYLAASPDGQTIVTGAGDETLRFWNVFQPKSKSDKSQRSILSPQAHIR